MNAGYIYKCENNRKNTFDAESANTFAMVLENTMQAYVKNGSIHRKEIYYAVEWVHKPHYGKLVQTTRRDENNIVLVSINDMIHLLKNYPETIIASNGKVIPFTDSMRTGRLPAKAVMNRSLKAIENNYRTVVADENAFPIAKLDDVLESVKQAIKAYGHKVVKRYGKLSIDGKMTVSVEFMG